MRIAPVLQPVSAGVIGTVTGFFGSVAVLLGGLTAVGASPEQAASGVIALSLLQGVLSIGLSWRTRIPVCFAWSTPGAALLAGAHRFDLAAAIGAFLLAGLLVLVTGLIPVLTRLIDRIPSALSGALLAGVLLPFCLAPVRAAVASPVTVLPLALVWLLLSRFAPRAAGPVVIVAALAVTVLSGRAGTPSPPALLAVAPAVDPLALVGLGLPLFLVTVAGQHLTGFAVLRANGFVPPTRSVLVASGIASGIAAPFGGVAVNLAAITGAIMVGPDAGPDPARRWPAGVASGVTYLVLAPAAALIASVVGREPPLLVEAAVGLALAGAFAGAIASALEVPATRVAAALTFLVVGSGITVGGIGSAFWGLVAGGVALALRAVPGPAALHRRSSGA